MAEEVRVILGKNKASTIKVPKDISEQSRISGFAFSERLLKMAGIPELKISASIAKARTAFEHASLIRRIATDSSGGPTVGENSITIWIDGAHPNAGSACETGLGFLYGEDSLICPA